MSKTTWLIAGAIIAILAIFLIRVNETPTGTTPAVPEKLSASGASSTASNSSDFHNWHEFSPPSAKFKVLVPTPPQHATEKFEDPKTKENRKYDMYVSEADNGTIFIISQIAMMEPTAKIDQNVLTNVMNDILSANPKSKLKNMQMGKYHENPSLDFSIENDQVNIDGKAFISGNTLFMLTSVAKLANYKKPEFDFFVNSFQLTPESEKQ